MNAFAENPLFLFMDNVSPPIIAVKTPKETRKIVELTDAGCDAIITVPSVNRKPNRCRSPRSPNIPTNEKWKFHEESEPYERFERNAMESDERCYVSISRKGGQSYWQKRPPAYEDFDETGYRRKSDDSRPGVRVLPETYPTGNRRRRDGDEVEDIYRTEPNTVRYVDRELHRQSLNGHHTYPSSPRRLGNHNFGPRSGPKYTNSVYPTLDTDDPRSILDRNNEIHRFFEDNYPFRNEIRNPKEHWQRCNDHEHFYEETQRSQRLPRYSPRNEKPMNSTDTPSEVSRDWDSRNYATTRTRSRTCSPPSDRRKRTHTYPKGKPFYEEEQPESMQEIFTNNLAFPSEKTGGFIEGTKRYVDRAVDKDSLSELQHTGTCTEVNSKSAIEEKESGYIAKCPVRTCFWDFIPLDDGNDKNRKILPPKRNNLSSGYAQQASPTKDTDSRSKRRLESINTNPLPSIQKSRACTDNNLDHTEDTRQSITNKDSEEQNTYESKNRVKVASRLNFGWVGKNRSDLKRPGSNDPPVKSNDEQNKKKRMVDGNCVTNLCEKTVTSLKRKLDKSEAEKISVPTAAYSITEKKTRSEESSCSRIPVRIGNRLRSRNPVSLRVNLKPPHRQETKQEDDPTRLSSTRSRTKPKMKSSLLANEFADLVETSEHGRSIGEGGGEKEGIFTEEKPRSSENHVDAKELSEPTLQAEPKDSKNLSETETNLENVILEEIGRLTCPRNNLKEKCCFEVDDEESMVCSNSCDKDGNFSPTFHSKKPTAAIRMQF